MNKFFKPGVTVPAAAAALLLAAAPVSALTIQGDQTYVLNDGAMLDATAEDGQSTFSNEFAINSDVTVIDSMNYGTGTISLGEVSIVDEAFVFAYDIQETGNNPPTDISDIIIEVDGIEVWSYEGEQLDFNLPDATPTDSPLGNGADAILSVSLTNFFGYGFTSDSVLSFYWLQENDDNGPDEWVTSSTGTFLDGPLDPQNPPVVPLPAGMPLILAALGALGWAGRRRS